MKIYEVISEYFINWGLAKSKSVDWRDSNNVPPVKEQGSCGSCWSFATVATVESAYSIAGGNMLDLSEQQLVDCDTENLGCNGGWIAYFI